MITALAGAVDVELVQSGEYTIVDIGPITDMVIIAMVGFLVIGVALFYHVKGAFCITLVFNTIVWWSKEDAWPSSVADAPTMEPIEEFAGGEFSNNIVLVFELIFLCLLTLSGLVRSLSELGDLTRKDGTTPRNRWLFIICGLSTVFSGFFRGPPILISPESAAGIKAGARTGLSTIVCGICFFLASFFSPITREVPHVATAPLLLAVGVLLSQNTRRIDWNNVVDSFAGFCCLFFIPFTYNILFGVGFGYISFVFIGICTGFFSDDLFALYEWYDPVGAESLQSRNGFFGDNKAANHSHQDVSYQKQSLDITPRSSVLSFRSAMDSVDSHVSILEGFWYHTDDDSMAPRRSSLFIRPSAVGVRNSDIRASVVEVRNSEVSESQNKL